MTNSSQIYQEIKTNFIMFDANCKQIINLKREGRKIKLRENYLKMPRVYILFILARF
jgi:hypothetical protein